MTDFFIAITVLYLLTHIFLYKGFFKSFNLKKNLNQPLPKVSVIVAARNEENNIVKCITALSKINYPEELIEIILVNDNSTDKTYQLMLDAANQHNSFKIINSGTNLAQNLKGKANAIDKAIELCTGEIILSTDADCEVPSEWVSETIKYYEPDTGMICGFTIMNKDKSLFSVMQSIDWLYLLSLASASAGLKMILSCVGNNLSFRKSAYHQVGGYKSINFSVTEDLALMRKIDADKNFSIRFPVDKDCLVKTNPCKNINELLSQKRRWFKGGIGINILGYLIGIQLYLMNILLISGLFFIDLKIYFALIALKMFSELILVHKTFQRFHLQHLYVYYPLFNIYFALYGLILPVSFLVRTKIKWKDRKF